MKKLLEIFRRRRDAATEGPASEMMTGKEPKSLPLLGRLPRNQQLMLTGGLAVLFMALSAALAVYWIDRGARINSLVQNTDTMIADLQRLSREMQRIAAGESRNIDDVDSTGRVISLSLESLTAGANSSSFKYDESAANTGRLYVEGASANELISFQLKSLRKLWQTGLEPVIERLGKSRVELDKAASAAVTTREAAAALDDDLERIFILAVQSGYPESVTSSLVGARTSLSNVTKAFNQAITDPRASIRGVQTVPADVKTIAAALANISQANSREVVPARLQPALLLTAIKEAEQGVQDLTKTSNELFESLKPVLDAKSGAVGSVNAIDEAYVYTLALRSIYLGEEDALFVLKGATVALGLGGVLFLLLMFWANSRESARAAYAASREYSSTEESIGDFFTVLQSAAMGDISKDVVVREGLTGAISDAFNLMLENMRDFLGGVKKSASSVAKQVHQQGGIVSQVRGLSEEQSREMDAATSGVASIRRAADEVAGIAQQAADQARSSSEVVNSGSRSVDSTVKVMSEISEVQQTALKLIKRVAERSQEVGEISDVLGRFHEQIRVLALNAAVEAKRAGQHGVGFGVVAEEIQNMSKNVAASLQRIDRIVTGTISDTNDAVAAVDKAVSKVVEGTRVAKESGDALSMISAETTKLVELVLRITTLAANQAAQSGEVNAKMASAQEIAKQMRQMAETLAAAADTISKDSAGLNSEVAKFKTSAANDESAGTGVFVSPHMAAAD